MKADRLFFSVLVFALLSPLVFWIADNYSRDYLTYLDIINYEEPTDLIFQLYIIFGATLGLSAEAVYFLFSSTLVGLLVYFFTSRNVKIYWISIYLLSFGLLHVVTQVRVGLAGVVIGLLLTSTSRWVRPLTPFAVAIHSSSILFVGAGFVRKRPWLSVLCILSPPLALVLVGLQSDKLAMYALELNDGHVISITLITYIVLLLISIFSRIESSMKIIILTIGILTIIVYVSFIDLKAVSNRIVELSSAVTLLLLGALDQPNAKNNKIFNRLSKLIVLTVTLLLFYASNVTNSILNL